MTETLHIWQEIALLVASIVAIVAGIGGTIIRVGRQHIKSAVREAIDKAMGPLQLELRTMNGEMERITRLEAKIENGLTHAVRELQSDVRQIRDHTMPEWDGRERRTGAADG